MVLVWIPTRTKVCSCQALPPISQLKLSQQENGQCGKLSRKGCIIQQQDGWVGRVGIRARPTRRWSLKARGGMAAGATFFESGEPQSMRSAALRVPADRAPCASRLGQHLIQLSHSRDLQRTGPASPGDILTTFPQPGLISTSYCHNGFTTTY